MVKVGSEWFDDPLHKTTNRRGRAGVYRGWIEKGQLIRFTLRCFADREAAELWAWGVLIRWRAIYTDLSPSPSPKGEGSRRHAVEG